MSRVSKKLTEHKLRQRSKSMLDAGHADDADLDIEAADLISALERELEEARALNNKYAWERDKAREERDATERRSEAFWKPRLTAAEAKAARMGEALGGLLKLNDDYAPFGGEIYRDRVDCAWAAARSALQSEKDRDGVTSDRS